jgi:hypothetical protein
MTRGYRSRGPSCRSAPRRRDHDSAARRENGGLCRAATGLYGEVPDQVYLHRANHQPVPPVPATQAENAHCRAACDRRRRIQAIPLADPESGRLNTNPISAPFQAPDIHTSSASRGVFGGWPSWVPVDAPAINAPVMVKRIAITRNTTTAAVRGSLGDSARDRRRAPGVLNFDDPPRTSSGAGEVRINTQNTIAVTMPPMKNAMNRPPVPGTALAAA